jgi:hypothetical protein
LAEREGIEPTPRRKRQDNGFEDRRGHQAPITLRAARSNWQHVAAEAAGRRISPLAGIAWLAGRIRCSGLQPPANVFENGLEVREFTRLLLGINEFVIDANLEDPAPCRNEFERADILLQL